MKRLVLLIFFIVICITGFLFARGTFSPVPESGMGAFLTDLFNNPFSGVIALVFIGLLAAILYRQELRRVVRYLFFRIPDRLAYQESCTEPALARKVANAERRMADTEEALNNFSAAIERYARHLSSHTGAIRGLNAASQELHRGAAAQNRVLMHFMENMERPRNTNRTPHWRVDPPPLKPGESPVISGRSGPIPHPEIGEIEKRPVPPGCARNPQKKIEKHESPEAGNFHDISSGPPAEMVIDSESLLNVQKTVREIRARQGKTKLRQNIAAEALAAEEEILEAIRKLNAQLDNSEPQE